MRICSFYQQALFRVCVGHILSCLPSSKPHLKCIFCLTNLLQVKFYTTVNITDVKTHGSAARGEKIDADSFELEGGLIELLGQMDWFPQGLTSYVNIQRQFFDGFVGQTFKDADKLVGGYILVFVYVNLMLSKMNFVEQRIGLSIVGIMRSIK